MKKLFFSVMALMLSINMFAIAYTSRVTITLYDGVYYPNLIVGETDDPEFATGDLVNGYYAPVNDLASMPLAVYVLYQGVEYENLIMNNLKNFPIGIKTSDKISYSLYFGGFAGSDEMLIYDKVEQYIIHVNSENPYVFTIDETEKNSIINNRFVINPTKDYLAGRLGTFISDRDVAAIEGGHFYEIYDRTDDNAFISFAEVNYPLQAGTPVLYQADVAGSLGVTYDGDVHAALRGTIVGENGDFNGFVGLVPNGTLTVKDIVVPDGEIYVLVSAEGRLNQIGTGCTLTAGHAYINMSNITHPITMPAPGRRMLMIGRSGIVTDVEKIEAVKNGAFKHIENGAVVIFKNGKKFNLAGQELK